MLSRSRTGTAVQPHYNAIFGVNRMLSRSRTGTAVQPHYNAIFGVNRMLSRSRTGTAVQPHLYITLSLGSIEEDCVISETVLS